MHSTPARGGKEMPNPSNPLITVVSALYGVPGEVVDVTKAVQGIFDQQYVNNNNTQAFMLQNIQPSLFNISDPSAGNKKAFTIVYNLLKVGTGTDVLTCMRGAQDFQNLTLTAGPPRMIQVTHAIYATNNMGIDVTDKLNAYLYDPGNSSSLIIGSQTFLDALTDGSDPAPQTTKYFSVSFTNTQDQSTKHAYPVDAQ
jgi:hypothetical protein